MLHVLLYLLKISHIIFIMFMQLTPFIVSNTYILCFIVLINILVVTQWYINDGFCILTQLEYYIDDVIKSKELKNDSIKHKKSSILENTLLKIFPFLTDKMINCIIALGPSISTMVCLIKIILI